MNTRLRTILFWGLSLSFVVFGTGTVLYSQGWRLDIATLALNKVGAIYVRSYPKDADIHIDGKSVANKAWLLQDGTLISNLFPKEYSVRLSAPGYKKWAEKFRVDPLKVAEVKYAVLIPESPTGSSTVPAATNDFRFVAEHGYVTTGSTGGTAYALRSIPGDRILGASKDLKKFISYDPATGAYIILDTDAASPIYISSLLKKAGFSLNEKTRMEFSADDSQTVFAWDSARISSFDLSRSRLTLLSPDSSSRKTSFSKQPIGAFSASRYYAAWSRYDAPRNISSLSLYDMFLHSQTPDTAFYPGRTVKIAWTGGHLAVLQDTGDLYLYFPDSQENRPIASRVRDFVFSKDSSLAAVWGANSLEILSFGDKKDYRRFLLPNQDKITSLEWYADNEHAIVGYPSGYYFLDLNDKTLSNFALLTDSPVGRYDIERNTFSYLLRSVIWEITFPK